jgi:hypothetical protein
MIDDVNRNDGALPANRWACILIILLVVVSPAAYAGHAQAADSSRQRYAKDRLLFDHSSEWEACLDRLRQGSVEPASKQQQSQGIELRNDAGRRWLIVSW